jgi:hypothetical protein
VPKQLKEVEVPRKCNTSSFLIIKYIVGCNTNTDKSYKGI